MKKLLGTTLALTVLSASMSAFATSTITIPVNNSIAANATAVINLDTLTPDVPYMVTCDVEASADKLDINLAPKLAPKGGYGVSRINDREILKNTGALQNGHNTLSFMASIAPKSSSNTVSVKNLDNHAAAVLKSCQAQPVSNVTMNANKVGAGYFYVTNYLGYYLDITVGNFSPTPYCIPPYYKQYIFTTTSYQDIDVVATHY
jgi:hypothetical protein